MDTPPDVAIAAARTLQRAGDWDTALALLGDHRGTDLAELRAEILVDRHWWRLDDPEPARAALDALDHDSPRATYLRGQAAYTRIVFALDPLEDDARTASEGFRAISDDEVLGGWGAFWTGVVADNVHDDPGTARTYYQRALTWCRRDADLLLESYVVRHLAGHAAEYDPAEAEMLLRRSLHLRSALGARPHTAAAQLALAGHLPDGPERRMLREVAGTTAEELGLTWLKRSM